MPQKTLLVILTLLFYLQSNAQLESESFHYGFSSGVNLMNIGDVQTSIIRPIFPAETYNVGNSAQVGFQVSSFVFYRFKNSKFAINPQITYQSINSSFDYSDIESFSYTMNFKYDYLKVSALFKFYTAQGFNIVFGPGVNLITNPSNLSYNSSDPDLGPDLQIQQSLRQVLKGNHILSMHIGAGYDLPMGFGVRVMYELGLSDAIQTLANGFYFVESKNTLSGFSVSLSYAIPFYK